MKFFSLLISLMALAHVKVSARLLGANRVIERFKVAGSDAGRCKATLNASTACNKNFNIIAEKFSDGTVKGMYQNVFQANGRGWHGIIDCLNIVQDSEYKVGIVSGVWTYGGDNNTNATWFSAAKIDSGGTAFYTFSYSYRDKSTGLGSTDRNRNCTAFNETEFIVKNATFWEHFKGQVTIEILNK